MTGLSGRYDDDDDDDDLLTDLQVRWSRGSEGQEGQRSEGHKGQLGQLGLIGQEGQDLNLDRICIFTIFGFVANLRDLLSLLAPTRSSRSPCVCVHVSKCDIVEFLALSS